MADSEVVKLVLLLGSISGAIAGIIALVVKLVRAVRKVIDFFKNLKDSVDTLVEHDKDQFKAILKLTVVNENLPLSERITAAKKYFALGGNGDIKKYYEEHLKPFDKIEED